MEGAVVVHRRFIQGREADGGIKATTATRVSGNVEGSKKVNPGSAVNENGGSAESSVSHARDAIEDGDGSDLSKDGTCRQWSSKIVVQKYSVFHYDVPSAAYHQWGDGIAVVLKEGVHQSDISISPDVDDTAIAAAVLSEHYVVEFSGAIERSRR